MLLRRRLARVDQPPPAPASGFEHLAADALAVLRWLVAAGVQFVLVGPVAEALRGRGDARGPVAIVPAPYRRNLERLARALQSEHVYVRTHGAGPDGEPELVAIKLTAELLGRGQLRTLRIGSRDLDIEGTVAGLPSYQELLYEASRLEPTEGVSVEVASPEDIERYAHVRRTGVAPQITIARRETVGQDAGGYR
jgi:hypothetical protein